jgi:hypothetical protein
MKVDLLRLELDRWTGQHLHFDPRGGRVGSLRKKAAPPKQGSIDFCARSAAEQSPPKGKVISFEDAKRSSEKHGDRAAEKLLLERAAKLRW